MTIHYAKDDPRTEAHREAYEALKREWAETSDTFRRVGDRIGLFHICTEGSCRRARRCFGWSRGTPACWKH